MFYDRFKWVRNNRTFYHLIRRLFLDIAHKAFCGIRVNKLPTLVKSSTHGPIYGFTYGHNLDLGLL